MKSSMWDYWKYKKGLREAVDQYEGALADPEIKAAVAEYDRAAAALDALMRNHDEKVSDAST